MAAIETILFDLGNVLIFHDNAFLFRRLGDVAGLSAREVEQRLRPELWRKINTGELAGDDITAEFCRALEMKLTHDEFFALWNCHFRVNEEVLPLIEPMVGKVKLYLLSNTNDLHFRFIKPQLPLLKRFNGLFVSHEHGLAKPDAAFFQKALDQAGSRPEATAFFDDIPEYVEAAKRLGIRGQVFAQTTDFPEQLRALGV